MSLNPIVTEQTIRTVEELQRWLAKQPPDRPVLIGWTWRHPTVKVDSYLSAPSSEMVVVLGSSVVDR